MHHPTPSPGPRSSARDALGSYLESIHGFSHQLQRDEETRLCESAQAGDRRALDRMVKAHLGLVVRLARRYRRSTVSVEDLINEGNIGLVRAVRKFDASHGLPFVPYAVWWVKQAMIMFLIQHGQGVISLPIRKVQFLKRLRREEDNLKTLLGRKPEDEELAERLNQPVERVREVRSLTPDYVAWEDYLQGGDEASAEHEDTHPAEFALDQRRLHGALQRLVESLPEKDRQGVRLYFGLDGGHGMNFADLGRSLRMTREGARQMIKRSLRRMRADPRTQRLTAYL